MANPFKFGTIVEGDYFTDRVKEIDYIKRLMDSENHLILISPRRFGKTSLVKRTIEELHRPCVFVNMQKVVSTTDFASVLLKEIFKKHQWEKLKHELARFRIIPTVTVNPIGESVEVSFRPTTDPTVALEDVFALLDRINDSRSRLIVVFDEFQEIAGLEKGIDKRLRAIMQEQKGLNYILLGSRESMMTEIFERKRSPFYHFGMLMHLSKIPYDDFHSYVAERLLSVAGADSDGLAGEILSVTDCHPYYTQQLASQVWTILAYGEKSKDAVSQAVGQLTQIHDLDFERLWMSFNNTDKRVMQTLCRGAKIYEDKSLPTSTIYSSVKRLMKTGYIMKTNEYEVEDPFFKQWIRERML